MHAGVSIVRFISHEVPNDHSKLSVRFQRMKGRWEDQTLPFARNCDKVFAVSAQLGQKTCMYISFIEKKVYYYIMPHIVVFVVKLAWVQLCPIQNIWLSDDAHDACSMRVENDTIWVLFFLYWFRNHNGWEISTSLHTQPQLMRTSAVRPAVAHFEIINVVRSCTQYPVIMRRGEWRDRHVATTVVAYYVSVHVVSIEREMCLPMGGWPKYIYSVVLFGHNVTAHPNGTPGSMWRTCVKYDTRSYPC